MKKIFLCLMLALVFTVAVSAAENVVFTYNSSEDIENNIESYGGMTLSLENGYAKMITASDPKFYLPVEELGLKASEYKYMKIRMKCENMTNENVVYQIFCGTSDKSMGEEGTWRTLTYLGKDDFVEVEIDLTEMSGYTGDVKRLRVDPVEMEGSHTVYVDYVALFDHEIRMQRYPEVISDEQLEELIKEEEEANKIKVTRPTPDKIVYSFTSNTLYDEFTDYEHDIRRRYEGTALVLENFNSDPHVQHKLTPEEYFYADDLPFLKIRFKPVNNTGENNVGQFFFTTDCNVMGIRGTYINFNFKENGEWQDLIIDLKKDIPGSLWSDIVMSVRYDHTISEENTPVILEYIGFFPTEEAAEAYALPSLLPDEGHDTVIIHAGTSNIILPADTVTSGDTLSDYIVMDNEVDNPDKVIGGAVVQYTDENGDNSIVALSDENTRTINYVANRAGEYSLTYNTKKYDDISGHWGYGEIMYATNRNLFGGISETEFGADVPMTRGMFITVLGRMQGIDASQYTGSGFGDVNPDEYYAPYIQWANENGIVSSEESAFMPESPITRSDMALYISNYIEKYGYILPEDSEGSEFTDIEDLSQNAQSTIKKLQAAGIMGGKSEGIFDPYGLSTRAEVAAVMSRLIKTILGLEPYFFATSEESMEFKKLNNDRLRFGAYIPHPNNVRLLTEDHIRTVHEAGIDFTVATSGYINLMLDKMGSWYERYGIEYVYHGQDAVKYASDGVSRIFDKEKTHEIEDFQDKIPYAGLSLVDEPGVAMFLEIGQSIKDFYEIYPEKMAFINLLPLYANEAQLTEGAWADKIEYYEGVPATYKTYLEEYVKQVPTPFICVDIYPCHANKKTYKDYAKAIEFVADACRSSGRDFWIFNQCCFWGSQQYVIDETDIYWQGYTVLSFGAKTILYYIFSALSGHYDTPLDENGKPNDTYYAMKKFHEEIRRFDEVYLSYDNLGVFSLNTENAPWAQLNNPYTEFDVITELNCTQPLMVGCFEAKDKKSHAFTLVNQSDRSNPKSDTVTFKVNADTVTAYIDGYPTLLVPDGDGYYTVTLDCGRGIFITAE